MNIIQQPNQDIIETIGGFQYLTKQRNYRLNKYCVKEEVSDGILLYNVLVGSLVFLKPYEYVNIYTKDPCDYAEFLVRNYFWYLRILMKRLQLKFIEIKNQYR